jgi:hypothetical protein
MTNLRSDSGVGLLSKGGLGRAPEAAHVGLLPSEMEKEMLSLYVARGDVA